MRSFLLIKHKKGGNLLYIYPSNRLEDLAQLLAGVIRLKPSPVLMATTILVPNPGMQHWLSLTLSKDLGVAMNLHCPLPTRFLWDVCRQILGEHQVPKQSPYKREVLVWRIFEILQSPEFEKSDIASDIKPLWEHVAKADSQQIIVKQYEFSQQLADVFEQYLVFRTQWLFTWEKSQLNNFEHPNLLKLEKWQSWFWQRLVMQQALHPARLQKLAMDKLAEGCADLPKDIYIFAISSISPTYLQFFDALAQHTNVHFFQLNPCVNYWGDAQSDLGLARNRRAKAYAEAIDEDLLHPLLRNLGHQGRDLINLLSDLPHQEIAAFEEPQEYLSNGARKLTNNTLLNKVQADILSGTAHKQQLPFDHSISVHACHSHVRELQVLKDNLLHLFANNQSLQPKDVLVMCPSIESYSPYILSIFTQVTDAKLKIPVSISDRRPIESEPLIVGFLNLLKLPNGRFDSTSLINLISIPAIANKFNLSATEIVTCALWLKDGCVDWGIDNTHVEYNLSSTTQDYRQSWEWGLQRLLVGLINANNDKTVNGLTPVNYIEGGQSVVLGKFLALIEAIMLIMVNLVEQRSLSDWSEQLFELFYLFFVPSETDKLASKLLSQAITNLQQNSELAQSSSAIDCRLVVEALESLLNIPEVRSQFHSGNVTFCSMLPMRSIPFKVVAILGLNQSDFPRQDTPFSINLMANTAAMLGDRSRRGDDRYLFLESLISAREHLHLSYQYKSVKDNSPRQASLILKMLIDYCWETYSAECLAVTEHGLHPFSAQNYHKQIGYEGSFDPAWWKHALYLQTAIKKKALLHNLTNDSAASQLEQNLSISNLADFLKDSTAFFAKEKLNLYFKKDENRDFEASYEISSLQESILKRELVAQLMYANDKHPANSPPDKQETLIMPNSDVIEGIKKQQLNYWLLSSDLPYLIGLQSILSDFQEQAIELFIAQKNARLHYRLKGQLSLAGITLVYDFFYNPELGIRTVKYTKGKPSLRHLLVPYIQYLVILCVDKQSSDNKEQRSLGVFYSRTGEQASNNMEANGDCPQIMCDEYIIENEEHAFTCLQNVVETYLNGQKMPVFLDLNLAEEILKSDNTEQALNNISLQTKWREAADDKSGKTAFVQTLPNPYFDYLFCTMPMFEEKNVAPFFACFGALIQKSYNMTRDEDDGKTKRDRDTSEHSQLAEDLNIRIPNDSKLTLIKGGKHD